jgi:hypothetical protein
MSEVLLKNFHEFFYEFLYGAIFLYKISNVSYMKCSKS